MELDLAAPDEQTFDTFENLQEVVQTFAKSHGYAVAIGQSRRNKRGEMKTKFLICVKSGKVRDRVSDRQKPLVSQKTECPFQCRAQLVGSVWMLSVVNSSHNHPAEESIAFHQHRKFPEELQFQVAAMSRAGIKPKEIASTISQTYPSQVWRIQDIYNLRRQLKAELLQGHSPIKAMLEELHASHYEYNYNLDESGRITLLFFAYPESLQLLQQYPEVLLMDCTYKTNRFNMPLLDILGSTGLGKTFYIAFIFLSGETEEDYLAGLEMLESIIKRREIEDPKVIVTDRDLGLMKSIKTVFPKTANLLCLWHINKNVLSHGQQHRVFEVDSEEEIGFLGYWNRLVQSSSPEKYIQELSTIEITYRHFPKFLRYLKKTWLDDYKEKFVRCWADRHLHFGHQETSRAEGAHSVIKRYLQVSTGDLHSVLTALALMLKNQHIEHRAALSSARNRTPQAFRVPMFQSIIGHITPYAIWRVYDQLQILQRPTLQYECRYTHRDSLGLPCYHIIQQRIAQNEVLYLYDFHRRWFFIPPPSDFIQTAMRPILNPRVIRSKGRPAGSKNRQPISSTRREPSRFETQVEKQGRKRKKQEGRKRTRAGRKKVVRGVSENESSGEEDSEEDRLAALELQRLIESNGEQGPLWAEMEEFAGMTRATQIARKSRRLVRKGVLEE